MKIVNILGGLGNQLFQYAMAIALKEDYPHEEIKLNKSAFIGYPLHNGFELDRLFDIEFKFATFYDLVKVAYPWVHYRLWQVGRRILPNRKSMIWDKDCKEMSDISVFNDKSYFDGYWQEAKFIERHRNKIRESFVFPAIEDERNTDIVNFIQERSPAFIHIRRGDYNNHPVYGGVCTLEYYKNAISKLISDYNFRDFLIFSNDISWCKENLSSIINDFNTIYIDWNKGDKSYIDMQLMSLCSAGIVANSSFSWWGAFLSNSDIILCPEHWTNIEGYRDGIIPDSWHKIPLS